MAEITVTASHSISAPSEKVYRILSDYRVHHPQILPSNFSAFSVESGGQGAGTVVSFRLKLGGSTKSFRQRVDEPVPGSVLAETDLAGGGVTTFTIEPDGSAQSRVRIDTRFPASKGVQGFMERLFAPRMLRTLYLDELQRLDDYAQTAPV
jgi:hypothetical protein